MSRNIFDNYYNFDENFVDEEDDENDIEDEESDTLPCPSCGQEIYDDAEICPECGNYVVREDRRTSRPLWIIVTTVLLIALFLFGFTRLF